MVAYGNGHTLRHSRSGAGRLKYFNELVLAQRRCAFQAHLLSELLELRQFHVIQILAGCHWCAFLWPCKVALDFG
ncbi:hypothetical protein BIFGAL_04384 [Bifidobacterium gallicum DSM 20093 = LMG 11596]|uniref:Uncharacterized protein n=1 Tax=Bifidobacterium gallicum DSM 20093 = LMG 11596 TaxID=561180 RepID=D1NWX7_9BIFI|nr:hypothetical protein BIFGAL_04384 [Bifidobacterium gallicum DSM 20093 = LMG 11596]